MRWSDSITDSMDTSLSKLLGDREEQGSLACCSPWNHRLGHNLVTEQQHDSPKKLDVISCTGPQALEPQGKREM